MNDEEKKKPPVHEIKHGAVKAVIWEREGSKGNWHEVSFARLWKDEGEGKWKESHSFRDRNLEDLAKAVGEAHNWILQNGEAETGD